MLRKSNAPGSRRSGSRPAAVIRTRRAYFDFGFGQLHVRTAFPATGGFDEQPPLFCIHPGDASSRLFDPFLAAIAERRSVYAPDLPGCGESDPAPLGAGAAGAAAIRDLARDLRLRRIDLIAAGDGAGVALEVASAAPDLVRRLVLVGNPAPDRLAALAQPTLLLATGAPSATLRERSQEGRVERVQVGEYGDQPFALAPAALAVRVAEFLDRP